MLPTWLVPCLLLSSALCEAKLLKPPPPTTSEPPLTAPDAAPSDTSPQDQELDLPPPSLLRSLYDTTVAVIEAPWTDSEAASRQGGMNGGMNAMRLSTALLFLLSLVTTVIGVMGVGSVGLLAAKALAVATLALFLTALGALKKHHHSDTGGQTVHFVPIQHPPSHYHDIYHERGDLLPPYLDRNV